MLDHVEQQAREVALIASDGHALKVGKVLAKSEGEIEEGVVRTHLQNGLRLLPYSEKAARWGPRLRQTLDASQLPKPGPPLDLEALGALADLADCSEVNLIDQEIGQEVMAKAPWEALQ